MDLFLLWLVVASIISFVGFFYVGVEAGKNPNRYNEGDGAMVIAVSFLWPLVLSAAPFIGIYFLGVHLGKKNASEKKNAEKEPVDSGSIYYED